MAGTLCRNVWPLSDERERRDAAAARRRRMSRGHGLTLARRGNTVRTIIEVRRLATLVSDSERSVVDNSPDTTHADQMLRPCARLTRTAALRLDRKPYDRQHHQDATELGRRAASQRPGRGHEPARITSGSAPKISGTSTWRSTIGVIKTHSHKPSTQDRLAARSRCIEGLSIHQSR